MGSILGPIFLLGLGEVAIYIYPALNRGGASAINGGFCCSVSSHLRLDNIFF